MVGQLIRLKAKMVWNTLVRQTVVLVLSIIGILYFGGMGVFAYVGLTFSAQTAMAPSLSFYLTLIGPVVFIGWVLLPVLFGALDNTPSPRTGSRPMWAPPADSASAWSPRAAWASAALCPCWSS